MATQARNLFEAATGRGRVLRQGNIACIIMDGNGAVVTYMQDFAQARKWAQSKLPTSNLLSDRARFLDQFQVLVSRPGSIQATRGNQQQLEKLVKEMLAGGYDLSEWTLPAELKMMGRAPPPQFNKKSPPAEGGVEPPASENDPADDVKADESPQ